MTQEERQRYSRHILLPGMGEEGQQRLLDSRVLIVGAGGLASPVALYLAAAGVGTIGIADGDTVSLSNLQRQVIHFTEDIGRPKVESAADKMRRINPCCHVVELPRYIDDGTACGIVRDYDLVIEASDNAASRYRISDACASTGKPCVMGGVNACSGQVMTCMPGTATYRDIFPAPGDEQGQVSSPVFSPVVGILGTIMATEAIKVLTGMGQPLTDRLLTLDALTMHFDQYSI